MLRPAPPRFTLAHALLAAACLGLSLLAPSAEAIDTVVIDAGHGGHDRGGIPGQLVAEKYLTLDTARRVQSLLQAAGYRTVMTRQSDVFVPLSQRVRIANANPRAIFVSIHFNSSTREGARGLETYYYGASGAPLASRIQSNILTAASTENRGVKRRGFYVLRHSRIPAVLVECGFLTNRAEARVAQNRAYRDRLAREIVEAIDGYKRSRAIFAAR